MKNGSFREVVEVFLEVVIDLTLANKELNPPSCNLAMVIASSKVVGLSICTKFLSSSCNPPINATIK